jgi:hypothetical protein
MTSGPCGMIASISRSLPVPLVSLSPKPNRRRLVT